MKIDLADLERLEAEATPGPWKNGADGLYKPAFVPALTDLGTGKMIHREVKECWDADNRLIAAMRNSLPALLAEMKAAREWLGLSTKEEPMQNIMSDAAVAREAYRAVAAANS